MEIEQLKEFGKVEQCEVIKGQFHCKITKGFKNLAPNISKCYGRVLALAGEKYRIIEKHDVDDNLFHIILKQE